MDNRMMKCTITSCEASLNTVSMKLVDQESGMPYHMSVNAGSLDDIKKIKIIHKNKFPVDVYHVGDSVVMIHNEDLDFYMSPDLTRVTVKRPFDVKSEIINELSCDCAFDKMFGDERITERLYMILHTYRMRHVVCYEMLVCYIGFKYLSNEFDLQSVENECFRNKVIPSKYLGLVPEWVSPYMFVKACKLMAMRQMLSGEMFARMAPSIPTMDRGTGTEYTRYVDTKLNNDEIEYMKKIFLEKLY